MKDDNEQKNRYKITNRPAGKVELRTDQKRMRFSRARNKPFSVRGCLDEKEYVYR